MALPKLNDVPSYDMVIPSTGEQVTFRPFLVKEQKVLLMALETQDNKQILKAIIDTIDACVEENINARTLATFDLEYMFTQIRAKSVGETSDVLLSCGECEHQNKVTVNVNEITVDVSGIEKDVKISDAYTIRLRYPRYELMTEVNAEDTAADNMVKMIIGCLDKLLTEDEIISFDDETEDEVKAFVDNLTASQLQSVMEFINSIPALEHEVEFDCEECETKNQITLKGIADFF
jgi:hypothetical protein